MACVERPGLPPLHGRVRAYTTIGVRRLPCSICGGEPSVESIRCCADGLHHPVCEDCGQRSTREAREFMRLTPRQPGRQRPYADYGLYRARCVRCGHKPCRYQWELDGAFRPVCSDCDLTLNQMTLAEIHHPQADELLARYRLRVEAQRDEIPASALRRGRARPQPR